MNKLRTIITIVTIITNVTFETNIILKIIVTFNAKKCAIRESNSGHLVGNEVS